MAKLIVALPKVAKLPKKYFFFFILMIIDFMKKRIEQLLEVSCMVLTSVANINCKCRTYKNNLLHAT